jgi:hypothetical protein
LPQGRFFALVVPFKAVLAAPILILETPKCMDAKNTDSKLEELILRALYENPGHEAILIPHRFNPPIMLSNIFRLGCQLKKRGFTTAPDRRMGGWHMRLLAPGIDYCQAGNVAR